MRKSLIVKTPARCTLIFSLNELKIRFPIYAKCKKNHSGES